MYFHAFPPEGLTAMVTFMSAENNMIEYMITSPYWSELNSLFILILYYSMEYFSSFGRASIMKRFS